MSTTELTVNDQLAALRRQAAARLPADVFAVFSAQVAALDAAGLPAGMAAPGMSMPDGDLLDVDAKPTTLKAARDGRAAVVVFYRGGWCPYCNLTLRLYQEKLAPGLADRDVALIAISPQKPDRALSMREKNELSFTVLSDPGNRIGTALGVLSAPQGDDMRAARATIGADVAATNADGTDTLPMPTVVIVDAGGTIRWIDVHPNYQTRTEPEQILAALTDVHR